jgi:hypothetical protein
VRREHIVRIAGIGIVRTACDHTANLVLRVDLMRCKHGLGRSHELVVEALVALLRIVPRAVGEVHVPVMVRKDAEAHDVAEAAHHRAVDLVEREPVAHKALVLGEAGLRIVHEEVDELPVRPAAILMGKGKRQLIVRKRHHGLNAVLTALLKDALVEGDAFGIGLLFVATREEARPVDGHTVALEAHLAEESDVLLVVVIEIHGRVARVEDARLHASRRDRAWRRDRAAGHNIRDIEALASLEVAALDLVGCSRAAPEKVLRKCHLFPFPKEGPG